MGKNKKRKTQKIQKTESITQSIYLFSKYLLDFIVCIYMAFILVVLPFYNEEGYTHIGTDKAMFFRQVGIKCGMVLVPVLLVALSLQFILFWKEVTRAGKRGKAIWQQLGLACREFCRKEFSCTDYFAIFYGVAVILSYICASNKEEALWGTSGWYMGTIPQLLLVGSYFCISRLWSRRDWLLGLVLPTSVIVFVLGYLNRFGIFPIDMKVQNYFFVSTIGNVNWYCGYLMCIFWGAFFLLWKVDWEKQWQKLLLIGYVFIGFATLVTHGSSSSVIALAGILLLSFCLSVSSGKRMETFWLEMCLFSLAAVSTFLLRRFQILTINFEEESNTLFTNSPVPIIMTIVSVVVYLVICYCNQKGCYPVKLFQILKWIACVGVIAVVVVYLVVVMKNTISGGAFLQGTPLAESSLFRFSPEWGSNRGATWTAGVLCFWEQDFLHKLVGVGPDCMADYIYHNGSNELLAVVRERFGDARLTNAHNEWLTILVNMGLLGFVGFVGMMVSAIKRFIGNRHLHGVIGACGFCLLAYTLNNMVSFQQSMSVSTIFIVLAVGETYLRGSCKENDKNKDINDGGKSQNKNRVRK